MKRLPSLDSLRAFAVAARHLSFTRAADELHVTQSALSHRVAALEAELEVKLFRRLTRRLELTKEGEQLAAGVERGLAEIARALASLDRRAVDRPVTVTVLPSFANRWLITRLARFRQRHPQLPVRILAEERLADLKSGSADLAIRFGRGSYPGHHVVRLMGDWVVPVCSPQFYDEHGPFDDLHRLSELPLLHDLMAERDGSGADWRSWLTQIGAADVTLGEGQRFNQAILTLEAAVNSLGLALGRRSLVAGDLAAGRLVEAVPRYAPTAFAYYLVCLPETVDQPSIAAFCNWLVGETKAEEQQMGSIPVLCRARRRGDGSSRQSWPRRR